MTVYVDDATNQYGRMIMCHMVADTLEELHEMAEIIGLERKWLQGRRIPHYDICKSKRKLAVRFGAKEVTQRELIAMRLK